MFALFLALVQTPIADPATVATVVGGVGISAAALIALMRKHHIKVKELAAKLGVPQNEVTKRRKHGLTPDDVQQWTAVIAGPTADSQPDEPQPAEPSPTPSASVCLLPANVASIVNLASPSGSCQRFGATEGVRVATTENGYRVEATNGRAAAIVTGTTVPATSFPAHDALADIGNATAAILPAKQWRQAFKQVPRGKMLRSNPVLGNVGVALGTAQSALATADMDNVHVEQTANQDGRFPELDKILPKGSSCFSFYVSATQLLELLKVAREFSANEDSSGHCGVTFEFFSKDNKTPFLVRAENDQGQKFLGVCMPLVKS